MGGYATLVGTGAYDDLVTAVGDPGLAVSPLTLGAHGRIGLGEWVELGGNVEYADEAWSVENRAGVLDIPDHAPQIGVGAHLTVGRMKGSHGFGVTLDAQWLSLPYAQYLYTGPPEYLEDPTLLCCDDGEAFYTVQESGVAHPIRLRGAGAYQYRRGAWEVAAGVALSPVFTNVGFSIEEEPVYESGGLAVMPVVDAGVRLAPVRFGVQGWYAAGVRAPTGDLEAGPGARVMVEYRGAPGVKDAPAPP